MKWGRPSGTQKCTIHRGPVRLLKVKCSREEGKRERREMCRRGSFKALNLVLVNSTIHNIFPHHGSENSWLVFGGMNGNTELNSESLALKGESKLFMEFIFAMLYSVTRIKRVVAFSILLPISALLVQMQNVAC